MKRRGAMEAQIERDGQLLAPAALPPNTFSLETPRYEGGWGAPLEPILTLWRRDNSLLLTTIEPVPHPSTRSIVVIPTAPQQLKLTNSMELSTTR
jgi:hypothetical protein